MNRRLVIVVAVMVAGFGAAYAVMQGGEPARPAPPVADAAPKVEVDQVLVASRDLAMGEVVSADALSWQIWPKTAVSGLMIVKSGAPNAAETLKGSMVRAAVLRGEPIRREKLVNGEAGFMSAMLPGGKRAAAIKIDNDGDATAGGFILPGDRVDVVQVARDDEATKARGVEVVSAHTVLANVRVLAIGQNVEEENGRKMVAGANATLELDPEQVNLIMRAEHANGGALHLALRALADSAGPAETTADRPDLTVIRFGAAEQAQP
jgi:pilus assembly protein CpaB